MKSASFVRSGLFRYISSLLLFSLKHEALLDNFKRNYFLDKGETIEVRFYKQIDGSWYKVFEALQSLMFL